MPWFPGCYTNVGKNDFTRFEYAHVLAHHCRSNILIIRHFDYSRADGHKGHVHTGSGFVEMVFIWSFIIMIICVRTATKGTSLRGLLIIIIVCEWSGIMIYSSNINLLRIIKWCRNNPISVNVEVRQDICFCFFCNFFIPFSPSIPEKTENNKIPKQLNTLIYRREQNRENNSLITFCVIHLRRYTFLTNISKSPVFIWQLIKRQHQEILNSRYCLNTNPHWRGDVSMKENNIFPDHRRAASKDDESSPSPIFQFCIGGSLPVMIDKILW